MPQVDTGRTIDSDCFESESSGRTRESVFLLNAEKKLGDLELKVMAILWTSRTPLGVSGVSERLQGERLLAYTTVMTVLVNLFKKGVVDRAKQGKAYLYWAKEGQDKLASGLFHRLLNGYYNGQVEEFFAAFLRHKNDLNDEELASIHRLLEEYEQAGVGSIAPPQS